MGDFEWMDMTEQEQDLRQAFHAICIWALVSLSRAVGGYARLSSTLLWEWASRDPVWALLLAKGVLSTSAHYRAFGSFPAEAELAELQRSVVNAVLDLPSHVVAFPEEESGGEVSIAARGEALARHRTELAIAVLHCDLLSVLLESASRVGSSLGPRVAFFLAALLNPEIIAGDPGWACSSASAATSIEQVRGSSDSLGARISQNSGALWQSLAAVPAAFGGQLPKGFLQDCANLAYFSQPPLAALEAFLAACLSSRTYVADVAEDAYGLGALCILAANGSMEPGTSVLVQGLGGLNTFGQYAVTDTWQYWQGPIRTDIITKWAVVVFNQPLDLAPKPVAVVVSSLQEQEAAAPAALTEGKAVLRNLVRGAPPEFCCALTGQLMMDPVQSEYGHVFERAAIIKEIRRSGGTCPASGERLNLKMLARLPELRRSILAWIRETKQARVPADA